MPIGCGVAAAMGTDEGAGHAMEESWALPPTPAPIMLRNGEMQGAWQGYLEGAVTSFAQVQSEPPPALRRTTYIVVHNKE